jgi:hypothetical protein
MLRQNADAASAAIDAALASTGDGDIRAPLQFQLCSGETKC